MQGLYLAGHTLPKTKEVSLPPVQQHDSPGRPQSLGEEQNGNARIIAKGEKTWPLTALSVASKVCTLHRGSGTSRAAGKKRQRSDGRVIGLKTVKEEAPSTGSGPIGRNAGPKTPSGQGKPRKPAARVSPLIADGRGDEPDD